MLTEEEIEALRRILAHRLEEILQNTSPYVLKIITDVLFVLLLKENVPLDEAEELVEKVREKKMGELFENLEPMDIQAERRNTAEERARAEKERERAEKAEEQLILNYIDTCLEFGVSQEEILSRLTAKFEMSRQMAEEWFQKAILRNIG